MIRALSLLVSVLVLGAVAVPAWSNGDLFFEAAEIPGKPEYVIYGSVKDAKGRHLESAIVIIKVPEPRLLYTAQTDILGRFRSLDIGRAIRGLGYDVVPSQIEISVEYPQHRLAKRMYRGKRGQDKGAVEWNFVMVKEAK